MRNNPIPNPESQAITRFLGIYKNLGAAVMRSMRDPESKELEGLTQAIRENLADVSDAAFDTMRDNIDESRISEIWHGDRCVECDPDNEGNECDADCNWNEGCDYDASVDANESFRGELENLAQRMGCDPSKLQCGLWYEYVAESLGEYAESSDTYWDSYWFGSLGLIDWLGHYHRALISNPRDKVAFAQLGDTLARFPYEFVNLLELACVNNASAAPLTLWVSELRDALYGLAQGIHESIESLAREFLTEPELEPIREWFAKQCVSLTE